MSSSLSITSAMTDPALLDLPWNVPLESWPNDTIATLAKGISRHLVRFARLNAHVLAVKETTGEMAAAEYEMLRLLQRLDIPCVEPVAVITDRRDLSGEDLKPVLVTRYCHPPRRCTRSAARAVACCRFFLGGCLALEHTLSTGCRGVRRLPGGRRNRQVLRIRTL